MDHDEHHDDGPAPGLPLRPAHGMGEGECDGLDRLTVVTAIGVRGLVRPLFPGGDRYAENSNATGLYLLLTEMIAVYLVVFPVYAFQVSSSSTGYVRVATACGDRRLSGRATGGDFAAAVASTISAPTAASCGGAHRHGVGRVGALGVSAALTLGELYYSAQDVRR